MLKIENKLSAWRSDSGASAVEFALLLPLLITLLFGAIDLGWIINSQIQLSNLANLGARNVAGTGDVVSMKTILTSEAPSLGVALTNSNISTNSTLCVAGEIIQVDLVVAPQSITGWFAYPFNLSASAAYVCELDSPAP